VVIRYIKFCFAGLITAVFDYNFLRFLLNLSIPSLFAKSVSWTLSAFISYFININFAFSTSRSRASPKAGLLFVLSQGVGGIAQLASFSILYHFFEWSLNVSFSVALVLGSILNFMFTSTFLSRNA